MTFKEIRDKVYKADYELQKMGLEHFGYEVIVELSLDSYRQLVASEHFYAVRTEVDTPTEKVHRGTIYGTPFVLTQDTDRVLIAKEQADK